MSETTHEIIIKQSGDMEMVSTTRTPTHFPEKVLERFAKAVSLKIPNMMHLTDKDALGMSQVGLLVNGAEWRWLARVDQLRFRTPVKLLKDGIVSPQFGGNSSQDMVDLFWYPHVAAVGMQLWFSVNTDGMAAGKCYLFATDENWRCYRLPTANVYEDCAICMGNYHAKAYTYHGCFMLAATQFRGSNWNSDLLRGSEEQAEKMFRFRPNADGEGFSQQSMAVTSENRWTTLCERAETTGSMQLIELAKAM